MKNLLKEFALYLLIATVLFNVTVNVIQQKYAIELAQELFETDIFLAESLKDTNSTLGGVIELLENQQRLILEQKELIFEHDINLAILNEITKPQVEPDFEKLMNGTVTIYNKGYAVGGVCIAEDETYYYILTVEHLLRDTVAPKNIVPESSMGLAADLGAIVLFLVAIDINEVVPKKEIINITVRTRGYTSVAGEFMYVNPLLDLGLLRVYKSSGIKLEILKIAETFPNLGDEVYVLGHPLGRSYNLSKGVVSNLDSPFIMGVDALITFGNSGGAVFNTNGEIIGICSMVPVYYIETDEESIITIPEIIK